VLSLEIWALVLGGLALWIVHRNPGDLPSRARLALFPAGFLLLIGVLQLLPAPAGWTGALAAPTAGIRRAVASVLTEPASTLTPESFSAPETFDALLRLSAYLLIGLASALAFRGERHVKTLAIVLAASGTFQALYGSVEYLSGHQHIFGYAKKYYVEEATGTFINRNHFAAYLAMTLPFALGLLLDRAGRMPLGSSLRERVLRVAEPVVLRRILAGFAVFAIWAGVFLSYSRGGFAAMLLAGLLLPFLVGSQRRRRWLLVLILVIPVTLMLLWQDVRAPGERFLAGEQELTSLNSRVPVWKAASGMLPSYALLGSGLGTFEAVFAVHQPPTVGGRWDHAHNEWLESVVEAGPWGVLALGGLVYLCLARRSRDSVGGGSNRSSYRSCAIASIAAIALCSLVDFPLRIPAVAVVVAVQVGMLMAFEADSDDSEPEELQVRLRPTDRLLHPG